MTPMLIFAGVPSAVAVATGANPLIASSITGTIAQYRRKNVDIKLACIFCQAARRGHWSESDYQISEANRSDRSVRRPPLVSL